MPAKNSVKSYVAEGIYHVYNRGVNKMPIFTDQKDYSVFLSYLKQYLLPKDPDKLLRLLSDPNINLVAKTIVLKELRLNNFHNKIEVLAYCLMPNHFHLLLKQKEEKDIDAFMQSFMTRYTSYYNKAHGRVGPLFQGRYKAVLVVTDEQLLYLTRYIHRNPFKQERSDLIRSDLSKQPSSYPVYLGLVNLSWVSTNTVLSFFSKSGMNSYQSFVEETSIEQEEKQLTLIEKVALDLDADD